jgi:shikimate dehydrogenase
MTALVCIIGDPVSGSLSPAMHNAAFAREGLDMRYLALRVPRERAEDAVRGLRGLGFAGANVTFPLKEDVAGLVDRLAPSARAARAVNTIVNDGGVLVGHDTDGEGAAAALEEAASVRGRLVAVLGAGGAARAICHALAARGARLLVLNRTLSRARSLTEDLGRAAGAEALPLGSPESARRVRSCDVLVNATTVGMGEDRSPLPPEALRPGMTVLDAVYRPLRTRLLREAEAAGARCVPGTRMLLHQGAASFRLWTGREAPLGAMEAALEAAAEGGDAP